METASNENKTELEKEAETDEAEEAGPEEQRRNRRS